VISTTFLTSAILSLRQKLGTTQEEMARQIGCTLAAYQRWETGKRTPRGDWMLKILVLCPDEETRSAFFVDIGEISSKIPLISRPKEPIEKGAPRAGAMMVGSSLKSKHPENVKAAEILAARYYNDAVMALDELYGAAHSSPGALEELRSFAERLVTRAGDWRRIKNPKKGGR
jgi:transcriptional regulator with XRE-family HTH domain